MVTGTRPTEGTYAAAFQHIVDATDHARTWDSASIVGVVSRIRDRELREAYAPVIEAYHARPTERAVNTVNRFCKEMAELLDQGKVDEAIALADRQTRTELTTFGKEVKDEAAYKRVVGAACEAARLGRLEWRMMDELGKVSGKVIPGMLNAYQVSSYSDVKAVFDTEKKGFIQGDEAGVLKDWVVEQHDKRWVNDRLLYIMEGVKYITRTGTPQDVHDYLISQINQVPSSQPTTGPATPGTAGTQQQGRTTGAEVSAHWVARTNKYIGVVGSWAEQWLARQSAELQNALSNGNPTEGQAVLIYNGLLAAWCNSNSNIKGLPTEADINSATSLDESRRIGRMALRTYALQFGKPYMDSIGLHEQYQKFLRREPKAGEKGEYYGSNHNIWHNIEIDYWEAYMKAKGKQGENPIAPPPPPPPGVVLTPTAESTQSSTPPPPGYA